MISILIAILLAQQVSSPTAAPIAPTTVAARVAGRVINSLTGDPVARAVVILRAHDTDAWSYADETDAQGHFSIPEIEPGEYATAVDRAGFTLESSGAAGAPGPTVKIDVAQRVDDLTLRVDPLGVIAGRIVDAEGEPARGAQVEALHYIYANGKKQFRVVTEVEAGDRGDFRLFGLRAGTYYLKATGLQVAPFELVDKATITYYPGTADSSRAVPVELRTGAQMRGFDLRLQSSGAYSIRFQFPPGITLSPVGSQLFNSQGLLPTEGWESGTELGFGNVPPGSYEALFIGMQADKQATPGGMSMSLTRTLMAECSNLYQTSPSPARCAWKGKRSGTWGNCAFICNRAFMT